jgi:hypothetical protein
LIIQNETIQPSRRQCTHIKANGIRCGSPALKEEYFCYFHTHAYKGVQMRFAARIGPIGLLEDRHAVQASIMEVMELVRSDQITTKQGAVMAKLLELAVRNGRNLEFDDEKAHASMVTDMPDFSDEPERERHEGIRVWVRQNAPAMPQPKPEAKVQEAAAQGQELGETN